jgi:CRISPR-associated protein Cas1
MAIVQHLVVEEFGRHLGKHQERLQVTDVKTGQKLAEAPLLHLESVLIASRGVSVSTDAIAACTERGIPINFLNNHGEPIAALYSAGLTGTVLTRRAQLRALEDGRGRAAAIAFCTGKLRNQCNLLRYMAKYRKETAPEAYEALRRLSSEVLDRVAEIEGLGGAGRPRGGPEPGPAREAGDDLGPAGPLAGALQPADELGSGLRLAARLGQGPEPPGGRAVEDIRFELLSAEGRGAQKYWEGIRLLLREDYDWPGRRTHGAYDPVNSALNYGYGVLYGQVERAIVLAGLDPYAGFLHVDRSGKPSLVLDLIEEFRAAAVDRAVLSLVNKGGALALDEKGRLDASTRKMLASKVWERLDAPTRYEGKQQTLGNVLQAQARRLATFLRGDRAAYEPFVVNW